VTTGVPAHHGSMLAQLLRTVYQLQAKFSNGFLELLRATATAIVKTCCAVRLIESQQRGKLLKAAVEGIRGALASKVHVYIASLLRVSE